MNIDNETIEIYNSAIKQIEYLNLTLTKENIKKLCEVNIYAICQAFNNNDKILESEKQKLDTHYKKINSKILSL